MPSLYLLPDEYAAYGVPQATADKVLQASLLIDAYLERKEGLVYVPDYQGAPAFMAATFAAFPLTAPDGIAAGSNVVVNVAGPVRIAAKPGTAVVIDRASISDTANNCEIARITAVNGNTITLDRVALSHPANTGIEFGMFIEETRSLADGRAQTTLAQWPVLRLASGVGRYGYGRRDEISPYMQQEINLLSSLNQFGGPPQWAAFDVDACDIDALTGAVWVVPGFFIVNYTDVKINYVAGYLANQLPPAIKQACANIISAAMTSPLNGNLQQMKAGDTTLTRFADSVLDADTKQMLNPYRARTFV